MSDHKFGLPVCIKCGKVLILEDEKLLNLCIRCEIEQNEDYNQEE